MRSRFSLVVVLIGALGVSSLQATVAAEPEPSYAAGQLLVGYVKGSTENDKQSAREAARATKISTIVRERADRNEVELVKFPSSMPMSAAQRAFEANPNVLYAEPNWILTKTATSNDPSYLDGSLWGMYGDALTPSNTFGTHANEAWANSRIGSATVYVGIIDEGIDFSHPELTPNRGVNPGETAGDGIDNDGNGYIDDVYGWDFFNNDRTIFDSTDGDTHGTHVAGTIGAVGGNGVGVAGVAWNVRMLSGKFLGPNGGYTSDAVRAVNYFTDLKTRAGLNIVATNNSWGGGGYSATMHAAIIGAAKANILFIAAAGNNGKSNDTTLRYPSSYNSSIAGSSGVTAASYDNVIAVAAISSTGALASFSNFGATQVDIGAPGVGILSTQPGGGYASWQGTSMATPHVTGAAALISAAIPSLTGSDLRSRILGNATATSSLSGKVSTGGRLDLSWLGADSVAPTVSLTASPTSVAVNSSVTLTATASDAVGVSRVEFYANGSLLGTNSVSGKSVTTTYAWTPTAAGTYSITAKAFDAASNSTLSSPASVTVTSAVSSTAVSATVQVSFSGGRTGDANLNALVTVVNSSTLAAVSGARVTIQINSGQSVTGTTNTSGQVLFTAKNVSSGTYSVCVISVTGTNITFSGTVCSSAVK